MIIALFAFRRFDDIFLQWDKKKLLLSGLSGVFGVFLAELCFCLGLKTSQASFTSPWMLLNPIFVTIFAIFLKIEKIQPLKTFGLCVSIAGTVSLIFFSNLDIGVIWIPVVMLFLSSVFNAAGIVIWRILLQNTVLSPGVVATWSLIVGTICMLVAFILEPIMLHQPLGESIYNSIAGSFEIPFCSLTIMVGYAINYSFLAWATHKSSISIVALYASARPIFTIAISFIIDNTWNTALNIINCFLLAIVICGILITSYSKKIDKVQKLAKLKSDIKSRLQHLFSIIPTSDQYISKTAQKRLQIN